MTSSKSEFAGHALCQAMYLEGIPKEAEQNIEGFIRKLMDCSGPDFTLSYLKTVKSIAEQELVDENFEYRHKPGEISIKWRREERRPSGPLGFIWKKFRNPIEKVRVLGAIICALQFDSPTRGQLDKWVKAVRTRRRSEITMKFSPTDVVNLGSLIKRELISTEPFSHKDLTGTVMPYAHVVSDISSDVSILSHALSSDACRIPVAPAKGRDSFKPPTRDEVHGAVMRIHADYLGQLYTAPRISKTFWNKLVKTACSSERAKELAIPSKVTLRPHEARDYEIGTYNGFVLCDESAEYSERGKADYGGTCALMQKAGGKLRAAFNCNRFLNYTLKPLGNAIDKWVYPSAPVEVKNQPSGLRWASAQLRKGHRLVSLDLSSATDTLDFRCFTRGMIEAANEYLRFKPTSEYAILVKTYLEYFEAAAELPFWCEELNSPIQLATGQPLGLAGSFQILTLTNKYAGDYACVNSSKDPNDSYKVVGDDFIAHAEVARAYDEIIVRMCGSTNLEKSMESQRYGEFLSHIVTADRIYTVKPKYRPSRKSMFVNLEKSKLSNYKGIYKLSATEREAVRILSKYSVDDFDSRTQLPRLRSKDLSVDQYDKTITSIALKLITEYRGDNRFREYRIPEDQLEYLIMEQYASLDKNDIEFPIIYSETDDNVRVEKVPQPICGSEGIAKLPTETMVYDHHLNGYRPKQSQKSAKASYLSRAKDIGSIDKVLNSPEDESINIGNGMKVSATNVVLAAMSMLPKEDMTGYDHSMDSELIDISSAILADDGEAIGILADLESQETKPVAKPDSSATKSLSEEERKKMHERALEQRLRMLNADSSVSSKPCNLEGPSKTS